MPHDTRYPRLFVARSPIHGLGLFAGEDIEWGHRLIEYQGQLLSKREAQRRRRFYDSIGFTCLMQFGNGQGIDGLFGGNESRFINHSAQPNVAALREDAWRIIFYSLDDIAQGEELTFNYGFDPKHHTDDLVHEGNVETSERLLQPRNIERHTHHAHPENREHCLKLRSFSAPDELLKPQEGN